MTNAEKLLLRICSDIKRMGNDVISGDELFQEVSLAVVAAKDYDWGERNPQREKRVFVIARNIRTSKLRKLYSGRKLGEAIKERAAGQERISRFDLSDAEERSVLAERNDAIAGALAQLQPDEKAILLFRFEGNMSLAAIAAMQGKPESSIRSRFRRSLQKLARHETLAEYYWRN